jgi:multimeric flavodoxin WrbA
MKILVLNGSPKGDLSVTMQYVAFLQKMNPQHTLKILNIAQQVRQIEQDEQKFNEVMAEIANADGVLWAFPLYVFLVHSQYKRFIELIFERNRAAVFQAKYTAVLSTSIHFFDHTAHQYMRGICDDLNMNFYDSFSAEMRDLLKEPERKRLLDFLRGFSAAVERKAPCVKLYAPLVQNNLDYNPGSISAEPIDPKKKIVIVTDAEDKQVNISRMIDHFAAQFADPPEIVNLRHVDIKGSCLGCIHCGYDNSCVYEGKDEFIDMFKGKLKTADILVFAGTIRDRYLSSLWKTFFDRAFFNTHMPSFVGKQIAYIVSGPLQQLPNLRQILEAYTEHQQANLAGIVTDEQAESRETDFALQELAVRCVQCAEWNYVKPHTFLGVGGLKIFRDEIWGSLRFPFVADHQYYKQHGVYDFPQQEYRSRAQNFLLGLLVKIPAIRKELYGPKIKEHMIKEYRKITSGGE